MLRTYRYRLYPNQDQAIRLSEILDIACWLYNHALAHRRKRWNESRHSVSYNEQATLWKDWRNEEPDENLLRLLNMSAGQQVLRRLDSAYRQFLKGERGKPRFQRLDRFNSVNYKPGDGARIKDRRLYVQNVGLIRVRWHRELPTGAVKNIVIVRQPSGWYVLFQYELPKPEVGQSANPPVGIDVGISHALALSDGTVVESPRHLRKSLKCLRMLQRSVARKQKGGSNRRKAVRQLACQQERIGNQRRDFWHKTTRTLVNSYGKIALEDLSLAFMLRNGNLSQAAHDTGLGMFHDILDYKAIEAGVEVVTVNPHHTSQVCSGCGCLVPKNLSVRVHFCPNCGLTLSRDVNAARNILHLGRRCWGVTWPVAASVPQDAPPL